MNYQLKFRLKNMLLFYLILMIIIIGLLQIGSAQEPQHEIKSINLRSVDTTLYPTVFLNVTVLNKDGRPIDTLKTKDFIIHENGKEQKILDVAQANTREAKTNVVLVIDVSGSMRGYIDETKEAAKVFLENLNPEDTCALVSFATNVVLESGFTSDKQHLEKTIDNLKLRDATALYQAADKSIDLFKDVKGGNRAVLLLTDGRNTQPGSLGKTIDNSIEAGVPIFTIGLGADLDEHSLRQMAELTGGLYYHAPTAAELEEIYKSLAAQLRKRLWIKYVAKPTYWPRTHYVLGNRTQVEAKVALREAATAGQSSLKYTIPIQWWKIIISFILVELSIMILVYFLFRFFWRNMNMNPITATQLSVVLLVLITMGWYTVMFIAFLPFLYFMLIGVILLLLLAVPVKLLAK